MIGTYFYNKGKKKTSFAKVFIKKTNKFYIIVNGKPLCSYFKEKNLIEKILLPISYIKNNNFFIKVKVYGGGKVSKSVAISSAISKCICEIYKENKKMFKNEGLLKTDTRTVERKKVGFVKSRKKKQYSKR